MGLKLKRRKTLLIVGFLLFILIILVTTCRNTGNWLAKNTTPRHADAIVMLMGSVADRVLETADLYNQKISGRVIIVVESMGAYKALEARGVHLISGTVQVRNALCALGIPSDSITLLPKDAQSTQDEAITVRDYLSNQISIDTILLVSSAEHMRRATLLFEKAFKKKNLHVVVCADPSKYTSFRKKDWWKHKEEIQMVMGECIKLLNFWFFDIHKL